MTGGAGGDPSLSLLGLEGASRGLQSNMAFSPHRKVEVTIFCFENQSWSSQGVAVTMPTVPRHQGPRGGQGCLCPTEAEPSHGQGSCCTLQVPGARGAAGPGLLQPHVVVGCLWAWGEKTGVRGSQSPLVHWAHFSMGDAIYSPK